MTNIDLSDYPSDFTLTLSAEEIILITAALTAVSSDFNAGIAAGNLLDRLRSETIPDVDYDLVRDMQLSATTDQSL